MLRCFSLPLLGLWAGFVAPQAAAQSCSNSNFTGLYGSFDVLSGAAVDSTATFTVNCSGSAFSTVRVCIEIGPGSNVDGSGNRVLASGANTLRHELYSNAGRTSIWGSWGSAIVPYTPSPAGITYDMGLNAQGVGSATLTVYGRVLALQRSANSGTYVWSSANSPGLRYGYVSATACPTGAFFASTSGTSWTATVLSACQVSATSIDFGNTSSLTSTIDSAGAVTVTCTNGAPYKIALSYGTGAGAGTGGRRYMKSGATQIEYNIYKDAARTSIWGDSLGINTNDSTGTSGNQTFTAYGRVLSQTTPAPGIYSDSIVVTVNY